MNQTEFFHANAVDGELTPAQMMELLQLPEGDMPSTPVVDGKSGMPDAASTEQPAADTPAPQTTEEPTPTILARDGIHTIPYEKLVEAREAEKQWRAQAEAAQQQLAAMQAAAEAQAKATPQQVAAQASEAIRQGVDPSLFGDFSEEAIAAGVQKLVDSRVAALEAQLAKVVAPLQQAQAKDAETEARETILSKHPDAISIAESAELQAWVSSKPAFARAAYAQVIESGSPAEVIELLDAFKAEKPAPARNAAQAADAAIANAKARVPSSLSDIPGSVAPAVSSMEAMKGLDAPELLDRFAGMRPEQMWDIIDKIS
jgi:hypothetical protein